MSNQLTTLEHYNPQQIAFFAKRCKTSTHLVQQILKGQQMRIVDLYKKDEDNTKVLLQNILFGILELYTSAPIRDGEGQLTENAKLLVVQLIKATLKHFKAIGPEEIQEAFDLWAIDKGQIKSFYAKITVPQYIEILNYYKDKRNNIRQEIDKSVKLLNKPNEERERQELNKEAQAEILAAYKALVEKAKAGETIGLDQIPVNWAETLHSLGVLNNSLGDKSENKKEALRLAVIEIKRQAQNKRVNKYDQRTLKNTLYDIANISKPKTEDESEPSLNDLLKESLKKIAAGETETGNDKLKALQLVFYKKMVVKESILNDARG